MKTSAQGTVVESAAPSFEVASIRPLVGWDSALPDSSIHPGAVSFRNYWLFYLIGWAFDTRLAFVTVPDTARYRRYDIEAKAEAGTPIPQLKEMTLTLLKERLGMVFHRERRFAKCFSLVVDKGGPRLLESDPGNPVRAQRGGEVIVMPAVRVADLADVLWDGAGAPVFDETNLKGRYDITVDLKPYLPANDRSLAFFSAAMDQLGLKVVPGKRLMDFLVIDRINENPTEN